MDETAWLTVGRELSTLLDRLDPEEFEKTVRVFVDPARHWFFTGQGRSGLIAQMAAMRFMHIGRTIHCAGEASAPSLRKGDGLVIVSASGKTPVSLGFATIARTQGAFILVVTQEPASPIARLADKVLHIPAGDSAQFGGSLFEQSALVVLDSLILRLVRDAPDADRKMHERHANLQ
ncbi:MAG: SIS domain-containing protein [Phyllobacterium sp.]